SVAVVTGTASGKTLCYNLPVLDRLLRDHQARALYLFPTKALAQDQLSAVREQIASLGDRLSGEAGPKPAVYDGDTPSSARPAIRTASRLIVSNPDMLHTGILPHHTAWAEFFRNLQFVVVDEMHTYRGVFGSHVANVLRRLKRIARFYGAYPQFILTSATIANPAELAGRLVEEDVAVVEQDGAARGPKSFLIYNPPVIDRELGLRRSSLQESVRLAEDLLSYGLQTILFARSRRSVEIILTYLREKVPAGPAAIRGYRSGYLPAQRREIERGLRDGAVRAVVATNALELGIDIGGLGAAVLVGYPGSIAASWQQAGRAGRGAAASLAILVATADPLDQFLAGHPDYFFARSPEQALINPDNLLILLHHLRCAAFELPFQDGESFGRVPSTQVTELLDFLQAAGEVYRSGPKVFWMADQYPAQAVSLRSASAENVSLQVNEADAAGPVSIGQVDLTSASWMVHPQAIYLHEGQSYLVEALDLEAKVARLRPVETDYYTEPRSETTVALVSQAAEASAPGATTAYGEIRVTTQVIGYRQVRWYTHEQLGLGELDLPPSELETTGYWLALDDATVARLVELGLWTNAPNEYGPGWAALRQRVRQRDGYRCQVCGVVEQGKAHDVHHKVPFRTFASAEQANQMSNLVTLCSSCHHKVETNVRVRSGLAGLAFVLGHLAPLFLMCDTRDLGVHSDPQSPVAAGRPAVVLYDQAPGGIGFSQRLFELHGELVKRAYELVLACECADGCPSCVGPGGENGQGGKRETLAILQALSASQFPA
ncbi:MAG TPA: DEAD/DEAH box helicase, partial [Anaerolineales bacterium]